VDSSPISLFVTVYLAMFKLFLTFISSSSLAIAPAFCRAWLRLHPWLRACSLQVVPAKGNRCNFLFMLYAAMIQSENISVKG